MTDTMIEEVARAMYEAANLCKTPEYIIPWDMLEEKELPHLKESYFDLARAAIAAIIPEGSVVVPREDLDSKFCHRCANDQIDRAKFREMFPEKEPWTPDMMQAAEGG